MLLPVSILGPSQPPSNSGSDTGGTGQVDDGTGSTDTGGTTPVEESSAADTGNETNTGGTANSGGSTGTSTSDTDSGSSGEAAASSSPSTTDAAAPVPYVAPPTMTPSKVAEAQSSVEARERLDAAFSKETDEARARRFAEAAQERAANEALIASIVPPPENSPSLISGVEELRAEQPQQPPPRPASQTEDRVAV